MIVEVLTWITGQAQRTTGPDLEDQGESEVDRLCDVLHNNKGLNNVGVVGLN